MMKPATLLKVALLHRRFSRFLNCTNGIKSRTAQIKPETKINILSGRKFHCETSRIKILKNAYIKEI